MLTVCLKNILKRSGSPTKKPRSDADQVRLGLRPHRFGKTARDRESETRGKNRTGQGAIPGPAKGPSPAADKHGRHNGNEGKKK